MVRVLPDREYHRRRRLFDALGTVLGVRFGSEVHDPAAVVRFGAVDARPPGVPQLTYFEAEQRPGPGAPVELGTADHVAAVLAGRVIRDDHVHDAVVPAASGRAVASTDYGPVWTRHDLHDRCAVGPEELAPDERLRARLTRGRFIALLPLIELVRRVAPRCLPRTRPMATFVFDDPNLRRPTYGWLRFEELARHAAAHGYHANLAVIPLDCWSVSRRAADIVGRSPHLALVGHGNDHLRHELAAREGDLAGRAAQASERLHRAGRRWGLEFDPVMVPPHGKCSPQMMDALLDAGWEATAYWAPTRPTASVELEGWLPADRHVGKGLPGLLRTVFTTPVEELALRRYLGHGLILYGHHDDVAGGLDVLAEAAARVRSLGDVTWGSLAELTRTRVSTRAEGTTLRVIPHVRNASLVIDSSIRQLMIEPSPTAPRTTWFELRDSSNHVTMVRPGELVDLTGSGAFTVSEPSPPSAASPGIRPRPRALGRRILTESRDRLLPPATRLRNRISSRRSRPPARRSTHTREEVER